MRVERERGSKEREERLEGGSGRESTRAWRRAGWEGGRQRTTFLLHSSVKSSY